MRPAAAPSAQPAPGAVPALSPARAAINAALEAARAASRSPGSVKRPPPSPGGESAPAPAPVAAMPAPAPAPAMPATASPAGGASAMGAAPRPAQAAPWDAPAGNPVARAPAQPAAGPAQQPMAQPQAYEQAVADDELPPWVTGFSDESAVAPAQSPAAEAPPPPAPAPARMPAPSAPSHAYVVTPMPAIGWDGDWPALAAGLPLRGVAQQLAFQTELIECAPRDGAVTFRLRVPVDTLRASGNSEKLCAALQDRFPALRVNVDTELGPVWYTAGAEAKARRERLQQEAEATVAADPFVRTLEHTFDAFVVPGSVRPTAT